MKHKIKKFILQRIYYKRFFMAALNQSQSEKKAAEKKNLPDLTNEEKAEINKLWGKYINNLELGYPGFQVYKSIYGFDPNYLPFSYFFPWIIRVLNPLEYAHVLSNKGMATIYFSNIKQPELVARKIDKCILSNEGEQITLKQLVKTISSINTDLIIKKSTDSCCGRNIEIISKDSPEDDISSIINSFEGDYIIQKFVKQSSETALFNPSSLNTMRISTMLLNGKFSLCTAMIKFGQPNRIVDNIGAGGCCVGINDDGTFMEYGFNHQYDKIDSWNGIYFKGHKISHFDKVIKTAQKAHLAIPQCKFVGWDLAIDEKGDIILIEANLIWPGLFFAQLANGKPALRGREVELLQYLSYQPFPYGNTI